jgi:hypothetical protein
MTKPSIQEGTGRLKKGGGQSGRSAKGFCLIQTYAFGFCTAEEAEPLAEWQSPSLSPCPVLTVRDL